MKTHAQLSVAILFSALLFSAPSQAADGNVNVNLNEWKIVASSDSIPAGNVTLNIKNSGKEIHEILVLKLKNNTPPGKLPTDTDGALDEGNFDKIGVKIDEVEDIQPNTAKTLKVSLAPGRYAIVCNRVDKETDGSTEAHYMKGMSVALNVQ